MFIVMKDDIAHPAKIYQEYKRYAMHECINFFLHMSDIFASAQIMRMIDTILNNKELRIYYSSFFSSR